MSSADGAIYCNKITTLNDNAPAFIQIFLFTVNCPTSDHLDTPTAPVHILSFLAVLYFDGRTFYTCS